MDARMLEMARLPWVARVWDRMADLAEAPTLDGCSRLAEAMRECSADERRAIVRHMRSIAAAGAVTA